MLPATTIFATPAGPWARISDPAVAYDPQHNVWMISTLAIDDSVSGAAVLTEPLDRRRAHLAGPGHDVALERFLLRQELDHVRHVGSRARTTATATRSGTTRALTMSTSTDGGLTWG